LWLAGFSLGSTKAYGQLYVGPILETQLTSAAFFDKSDKDAFKNIPAPGIRAGVTISKRIKNHFIFNTGLQYAHKQLHLKSALDPLLNIRQGFSYIELPISYTLEFREHLGGKKAGISKDYEVFAGAGPVISYWMGSRGTFTSSAVQETLISEIKYTTTFHFNPADLASASDLSKIYMADANRFQFALQLVGGISFEPLGLQKIVITGKVEIGQTRFSKELGGFLPANFVERVPLKSRPISFGVNAAYIFNTKYEDSRKGKSTERKRR
jgi:hypothetical protein